MIDDSLPSPLQTFAARLAAQPPQVAGEEKDQILYACAFAAGQSVAVKSMRRWRTAVAVLSVLFLAAIFPYVREPSPLARKPIEPPTAREETPAIVADEAEAVAKQSRVPVLDAWQVRQPAADELDQQIVQLEQTDPGVRALTVGNLTRALMKP